MLYKLHLRFATPIFVRDVHALVDFKNSAYVLVCLRARVCMCVCMCVCDVYVCDVCVMCDV